MSDRRIIAIAVKPRAYDEILKLKGKSTWTNFALMAIVKLVDGNEVLEDEIANLPKKAEPKPKVDAKAKAEAKAAKVKAKADAKAAKVKAKADAKAAKTPPAEETVAGEPSAEELTAIEEGKTEEGE